MVNFFDRFPPPVPDEPEPEHSPPDWFKPPATLGGGVAAQTLLARTAETVLGVGGLIAYPNGFSFTVTVLLRRPDRHGRLFGRSFHGGDFHEPDGSISPDFLRLGVQFADGTAASNLNERLLFGSGRPSAPVLMRQGGGGDDRRHDMEHWVWPLPPPGPVTFIAEWPARGIAESHASVDGRLIREAAGQAISLWPDEPPNQDEPPD